ncbi:MAG: bifunctional folylpolyglutamate synthase/dihydrofolate synthase [Actinobacteria bacterium]|nr:bifunctional folylpolyglutamate synthase/dihydrofolate synthase [Actinomycetota bacterium]
MSSAEDLDKLIFIEKALLARWPESKLEPTLERIALLADALGSPQLSYPTIHLTGTNGKTTTSRMVDALLFEMGLRTGRFTSPHLESFLERISINKSPISAAGMIATYNDIALYLDLVDERSDNPISFFEAITALAFVAFAEFPVDVGIFEVGMGGEWDATNVINSAVSVITPIGFDHMQYLGNTLIEIARTKSGIIKPHSVAILAHQDVEVAKVLMQKCVEVEAIPMREGIEFSLLRRDLAVGGQMLTIQGITATYEDIFLPLYGAHQGENAAVALATVEAFAGSKELDPDLVRTAFAQVDSPGRCEVIYRNPTVIVDAAHNPHGAAALTLTVSNEFDFSTIIAVVAPMGDKDVIGILEALEPIADRVVLSANSSPRAMDIAELERLGKQIFGHDRVTAIPTLSDAIRKSIEQVKLDNDINDGNCAVLITGSVVTAGEGRTIVKKYGSHVNTSNEMRD